MKWPSAMKSASTSCGSAALCMSTTAFARASGSASAGGATTYPRRSAGNSTFEKVPTYTTQPARSRLCSDASGGPV